MEPQIPSRNSVELLGSLLSPAAPAHRISTGPRRQPLPPQALAAMREDLQSYLPYTGDWLLDHFVEDLFANDELVQSYLEPRSETGLRGGASSQPDHERLPIIAALRAADRAAAFPELERCERPLARVAAFIHPCAAFYINHPLVRQQTDSPAHRCQTLRDLNRWLLGDHLRALRRQSAPVADLLAAATTDERVDDVFPEQLARLTTAVSLATMRIHSLWMGLDRSC